MIIGVGIDIVEIERFVSWTHNVRLLRRFFHQEEIVDFFKNHMRAQFLATRFAAKEAFGKALGTGLRNMELRNIRVCQNGWGKPRLEVYGAAQAMLAATGGTHIQVSLTHEREVASAIVIIEGEPL
ncbi:holo-ACP synthase [Treponema pallidum]|uniref:Holo-[acyl-carrier-protein] synthase n=4 Tax=Treponema pallidum TaxID=160 RepID=ACPS_TREPA|nr:holo-ACP synthase [Treponema pallidum]B2S466.1 RecName: Full=Holo-[acyl-carrier-protein] synthase; Short=Holo-ACP synthase; AltName: Full=4'-phosphopantetheinyl transferase AcpS [Treponema pallidum subsp. pallidum SS14]O83800.1 RecName: Full=Holo-[acyl-carrier-protein] synthase; Short=Holo-ACP synthase; AltName: Full=4'-phosphopantetheinyl transferase AcpS [Treponema pallidum subsp. pallidum str. Nichols]AAC65794.1 holo-acyl-carrier protein synthase (acpS) [Treponema pallidum subsp. pallidum 